MTVSISYWIVSNLLDKQEVRVVEFNEKAVPHNQNSVWVDDCGETVSHDEHSAILESLPERLLDEVVSLQVNIRCGFVKDQYLRFSGYGPSQAEKLFLANREDVVAVWGLCVDSVLQLVYSGP